MNEVAVRPLVDRGLFSLHPEEDVTEVSLHRRQVIYFETSLRAELPECFVGANLGVYWVVGEYVKPWAGPDLIVSRGQPKEPQTAVAADPGGSAGAGCRGRRAPARRRRASGLEAEL